MYFPIIIVKCTSDGIFLFVFCNDVTCPHRPNFLTCSVKLSLPSLRHVFAAAQGSLCSGHPVHKEFGLFRLIVGLLKFPVVSLIRSNTRSLFFSYTYDLTQPYPKWHLHHEQMRLTRYISENHYEISPNNNRCI